MVLYMVKIQFLVVWLLHWMVRVRVRFRLSDGTMVKSGCVDLRMSQQC